MISDQAAIAWMVFIRHQFSNDDTVQVPKEVSEDLERRGWVKYPNGVADDDEDHDATITDQGVTISDLYAADYGINAIPVPDSED